MIHFSSTSSNRVETRFKSVEEQLLFLIVYAYVYFVGCLSVLLFNFLREFFVCIMCVQQIIEAYYYDKEIIPQFKVILKVYSTIVLCAALLRCLSFIVGVKPLGIYLAYSSTFIFVVVAIDLCLYKIFEVIGVPSFPGFAREWLIALRQRKMTAVAQKMVSTGIDMTTTNEPTGSKAEKKIGGTGIDSISKNQPAGITASGALQLSQSSNFTVPGIVVTGRSDRSSPRINRTSRRIVITHSGLKKTALHYANQPAGSRAVFHEKKKGGTGTGLTTKNQPAGITVCGAAQLSQSSKLIVPGIGVTGRSDRSSRRMVMTHSRVKMTALHYANQRAGITASGAAQLSQSSNLTVSGIGVTGRSDKSSQRILVTHSGVKMTAHHYANQPAGSTSQWSGSLKLTVPGIAVKNYSDENFQRFVETQSGGVRF